MTDLIYRSLTESGGMPNMGRALSGEAASRPSSWMKRMERRPTESCFWSAPLTVPDIILQADIYALSMQSPPREIITVVKRAANPNVGPSLSRNVGQTSRSLEGSHLKCKPM